MKKYLMTGMAAIAFCAAFTSCSKDENLYDEGQIRQNEASQIVAEYNKAFIAAFGQPAADQTWGFKGYANAGTRGVFANGNEWAANDRADCMYKVPPALTEPQMKIVRIYFQNVPNLGYDDPHWTDYFIQQVYKGGVDATKIGPNSPEKYKAADGSTDIIGSDHMDHLAAIDGDFVDHNNNFNKGDCGVYGNVLNYKGNLTTVEETYPVNSGNEYRHPDKINLMTNSTTKSFGYYNSNGSVRRTEYTGLVSWSTIKTWADQNGHAGEADCLNDGWNRSFMGFDFEMMVGPSLFQDKFVTINDIPGNAPQYVWDGTRVMTWAEYNSEDNYIKIGTEKIPYLSTNKNMYAGSRLDAQNVLENITQSNLKLYKDYSESVKNVECLNLPIIKAAFEAGYYPTEDKAQTWVKVGGTADGYYSDWIVTLTKAEKYTVTPPDPTVVRIIAEDLSISSDPTKLKGDFDFNDVVFDVTFNDDKSVATIQLVAAGGVLPLTVAGVEVHQAFGQSRDMSTGWYPMINTGGIAQVNGATAASFTYNNPGENGINIPVLVNKFTKNADGTFTDNWIELEAKQGQCPAKLCVNQTFEYCEEREPIDSKYTGFQSWVQGNKYIWW